MKTLKQWLSEFLHIPARKRKLDQIDEASDESFPASDPPSWAGWEGKKLSPVKSQNFHDPIAVLKEEHRAIMKATYLLHEQVERLERGQAAQAPILKNIIDFMRQFVENAHHEKEDQLLLPALERCGAPLTDCPLTLLKQDHESSLSLLTTLENMLPACEKNDALLRDKLIETLNELKDIYTRHTLKEENFIFPLAEKYLSQGAQKSLCEAFNKVDRRN